MVKVSLLSAQTKRERKEEELSKFPTYLTAYLTGVKCENQTGLVEAPRSLSKPPATVSGFW